MKLRMVACAAMIAAALGATSASAQRPQQNVTSVSGFVEQWQNRINNENLPVAEPKSWALRSMPRFAAFSTDRFALAQQATNIAELEMLLVTAPISTGMAYRTLAAVPPGNVALDAMGNRAGGAVNKSDPSTNPELYDDLVFTALNPCRIMDSRVVSGGPGPLINGAVREVKIGPYAAAGGGYASGNGAQGGSATGCGLDALFSTTDIKAVMVAVSTVNQTNNGYLTFYSATTPDPSLTVVSMWYRSGFIQTSFVVFPTDSVPPVWSAVTSRQANTEVIIDIVGVFAAPRAVAVDCATVSGTTTVIPAGSTGTSIFGAACASGYSRVSITCDINVFGVKLEGNDIDSNACYFSNPSVDNIPATVLSRCCRVPGR